MKAPYDKPLEPPCSALAQTPAILRDGAASKGSCLDTPRLGNPKRTTTVNSELLGSRLAFSVSEAAEILGVSEKTIRRLIARGLLKPSRALRHLLIPKKEIERFLDET